MALFKCFLPINPLGHNVSEMSSTGMTRGQGELVAADARERRAKEVETTRPKDTGDDANIVGVGAGGESFAIVSASLRPRS